MDYIELIKKAFKGIFNFLSKIVNVFLEKTFLQIIVVLWALSHFHSDFFKYSKFGVFIKGTDNITTHDHASFVNKNNNAEGAEKVKK